MAGEIRASVVCTGSATLPDGSAVDYFKPQGNTLAALYNAQMAVNWDVMKRGGHVWWADLLEQEVSCTAPSAGTPDSQSLPNLFRLVSVIGTNAGGNEVGRVHTPLAMNGNAVMRGDISIQSARLGGLGLTQISYPYTCTNTSTSELGVMAHELVHIYGLAHEDDFPSLMNASGDEFFSCGYRDDLLVLKLDADASEGLHEKLGPREDEGSPDFGMSNMVANAAGAKRFTSAERRSVRPTAFWGPSFDADFTLMNPRANPFFVNLRFFWVPNPRPGFNLTRDLRHSDPGAIEVSSSPLLTSTFMLAEFERRQFQVEIPSPPLTELNTDVSYHLVVFADASGDTDLADNDLMLARELRKTQF